MATRKPKQFQSAQEMRAALAKHIATRKPRKKADHTELVFFPHIGQGEYSVRRHAPNGEILVSSETFKNGPKQAFEFIARNAGWADDVRLVIQDKSGNTTRVK